MDPTTFRMMMGAASSAIGQQQWTTEGTFSFVVPQSLNYISAVCIARGLPGGVADGTATGSKRGDGGRGGDLRYAKRIYVTRGETLTISISANETSIRRGATILLRAGNFPGVSTAFSDNVGGGNGGPGGTTSAGARAAGGGGAGGYSGDGGNGDGGTENGETWTAGQGGAAAGGRNGANGTTAQGFGAGAGGGVGLLGEGASGTQASAPGSNGTAGGLPGSRNTTGSTGGNYGGGGGGSTSISGSIGVASTAGLPACRIIFGPNREYPSTNTGNL